MEPVQLFVPAFRTDECLAEIAECLDRGWTGLGFKTTELEDAWRRYTGLPHAHYVNSATAALHTSLALLKEQRGWNDDDEVITTALTFVSTNHAILYAGLKPVFADIDKYLCLDPASIEERISPRTRAVLFVGLAGNTGQLEAVAQLCTDRGLALILDAAHMAGTKLHGQEPATLADVTCYSFQAVKNMPTADSGMVCFKSAELDKLARQFTWLGISKDTYSRWNAGAYSWRYDVNMLGYKYHGNSIVAALGLVSLRYLDQDNARRREIAAIYDRELADTEGIQRIPMAPGCQSSRHIYQIRSHNRDALVTHLQQNDIFPGVHYRINTDYGPYRTQAGTTPQAEAVSNDIISLPLHLKMTDDDAHRVCHTIHTQHSTTPPPLPGLD